jgi:mRNA-degrading endonuclease toxin of MazEF toxin-antitoxin module
MKPWEIWSYNFPGAGPHPAVVLGTDDRVKTKPVVSVLICSSQRAKRKAMLHEVILDNADGLNWETLCKCDVVYAAQKSDLTQHRGLVTIERRRMIAQRLIQQLGLAGL